MTGLEAEEKEEVFDGLESLLDAISVVMEEAKDVELVFGLKVVETGGFHHILRLAEPIDVLLHTLKRLELHHLRQPRHRHLEQQRVYLRLVLFQQLFIPIGFHFLAYF